MFAGAQCNKGLKSYIFSEFLTLGGRGGCYSSIDGTLLCSITQFYHVHFKNEKKNQVWWPHLELSKVANIVENSFIPRAFLLKFRERRWNVARNRKRREKKKEGRLEGEGERSFFHPIFLFSPTHPVFPALEQAACRGNVVPRAWEEVDLEAVSFFSVDIILNKTLKTKKKQKTKTAKQLSFLSFMWINKIHCPA